MLIGVTDDDDNDPVGLFVSSIVSTVSDEVPVGG